MSNFTVFHRVVQSPDSEIGPDAPRCALDWGTMSALEHRLPDVIEEASTLGPNDRNGYLRLRHRLIRLCGRFAERVELRTLDHLLLADEHLVAVMEAGDER